MKLVNVTKKAILAVATVALVSSNVEAMTFVNKVKACVEKGCTKVKDTASSVKTALWTPRDFVKKNTNNLVLHKLNNETVVQVDVEEKNASGVVTGIVKKDTLKATPFDAYVSANNPQLFINVAEKSIVLHKVKCGELNGQDIFHYAQKVDATEADKALSINFNKKGKAKIAGLVALDIAILLGVAYGVKVVAEKAGLDKAAANKVAAQVSKAFAEKDFSAEMFAGSNMEEIAAKYETANEEEKAVIVADLVNEIVSKKGFWDKVAAVVRK